MSREQHYPDELTRQRYMEESFNKERDTRLRWYFKTFEPKESISSSEGTNSKQYEVFLRKLQASRVKPTDELQNFVSTVGTDHPESGKGSTLPKICNQNVETTNHRQEPVTVKLPVLHTRDMNAADSQTARLLYDGFSSEGKGRRAYLEARYSVRPEDKYNFPVISSFEYGWKLDDVIRVEDLKNPQHGRTRIVEETFYRNNMDGLMPRV